jgi:molybdopterin-guanine dinucleotide biosynthesis protein B
VPPPRRPDAPLPKLVSLLGDSGSGKTTLAAALLSRWSRAGLRAGYLKHASHGFEMDRAGKDTNRALSCGAAGVAVTGPGGFAYLEDGEPRDPAEVVRAFFADRDVVVLEGFRAHGFPAVVLLAGGDPARSLAEARGPLLAVVAPEGGGAVPAARDAPVFAREEGEALAAHLERVLGLRAPRAAAAAAAGDAHGAVRRGRPSP